MDPYAETLSQARLAYILQRVLDPRAPSRRLNLQLMTGNGNSATVTPYPEYPAFTVTVTLPPTVSVTDSVFVEVPEWSQGGAAPEFGYVSVFTRNRTAISLRSTGTITTSTFWPWMTGQSSMCKFHPKAIEKPRGYAYSDFARLQAVAPAAMSAFSVIMPQSGRPQPFRDEVIVYDEGDGD